MLKKERQPKREPAAESLEKKPKGRLSSPTESTDRITRKEPTRTQSDFVGNKDLREKEAAASKEKKEELPLYILTARHTLEEARKEAEEAEARFQQGEKEGTITLTKPTAEVLQEAIMAKRNAPIRARAQGAPEGPDDGWMTQVRKSTAIGQKYEKNKTQTKAASGKEPIRLKRKSTAQRSFTREQAEAVLSGRSPYKITKFKLLRFTGLKNRGNFRDIRSATCNVTGIQNRQIGSIAFDNESRLEILVNESVARRVIEGLETLQDVKWDRQAYGEALSTTSRNQTLEDLTKRHEYASSAKRNLPAVRAYNILRKAGTEKERTDLRELLVLSNEPMDICEEETVAKVSKGPEEAVNDDS